MQQGLDEKELGRLTKDYPHLALALLVEGAANAQEALQAQIQAIEAKRELVSEVLTEVQALPAAAKPGGGRIAVTQQLRLKLNTKSAILG